MKLSITEMYDLYKAQEAYDKQKTRSFKLSLLLVKNTKVLKEHLTTFEETRKALLEPKDFVVYMKEKQTIVDEHRIKNKDGSLKTIEQGGQMVYPLERREELDVKLKKLDAKPKNKKLIEANLKGVEEVTASMEEEQDITLQCITNGEQVKALSTETLVILAPIIKVKLTEEMLGDSASELTGKDVIRLTHYCEVEE